MGPFDDLIPPQNRRSAPPMLGQQPGAPLMGPPRQAPPFSPPTGYRGTQEHLEPIPGGPEAPDDALTPQAIDLLAEQYIMTGPTALQGIGGMGRAAQRNRQAVLNRVAELAQAGGQGATDLVTQMANYRTTRQTLQSQQQQLANLRSMEGTASSNLDALAQASRALPGQTEYPLVNRIAHAAQRNLNVPGHQDISSYDLAYETAVNEYARLISTGSSGNGQLTDAARAEAQSMLPYGASPTQLDAAIRQARIDMHNRITNYQNTVNETMDALTGRQRPRLNAQGSGVIGRAGMVSGRTEAPPTGPHLGGPAGPIEFGGGDPPPSPPGAEQFQTDLQAAINAHAFRTPQDIIAFGQARGFTIDPAQAQAAIRAGRAGVALPQFAAPDISDARGAQADPRRQMMENNINSGVPLVGALSQGIQGLAGPEAANAVMRGGRDIAMAGFGDEAQAIGDTLTQGGTFQQNLDRQNAIDDYDSQNHPYARGSGQIAAGIPMAMMGGEGLGAQMAMNGSYGAAYGFGSGRNGLSNRGMNALIGGGIGVVAPPVLTGVGRVLGSGGRLAGRMLPSRAPQITPAGQEIAQAAAAEGIPISRPIVDPTARPRMAYLESALGSGGEVRAGLHDTEQGIQGRVNRLGSNGAPNEWGAMGARVQAAGRRYVQQSGQRISAMYQRAAAMAGDTPVVAGTALQRLDGHIAELSQNAAQNGPLINYLQNVRRDLVAENGFLRPKTVAAIRDMRTNLRGNIDSAGLTNTNAERIMGDVLDGATQDVNFFLGGANPAANRLYQQADQAWRGRHQEITQIVDRLVGRADNPLGGGTVMTRVQGLASGDVPRLQRVMAMLSPQERNDLAATIASRAGYKSPDEPFSLQRFIEWQRALPDSARQVIFGSDGAQSIRNLTIVTRALQETRGQLNNSRSGVVRNWRDTLKGFLGGNWTQLAAGATAGGVASGGSISGTAVATSLATAAGVGMRYRAARILMNPDMSAWLSGAVRAGSPSAIRQAINRLPQVAARNPAISQEVLGIRQYLLSAANDNSMMAGRLAASPEQGRDQPYQ